MKSISWLVLSVALFGACGDSSDDKSADAGNAKDAAAAGGDAPVTTSDASAGTDSTVVSPKDVAASSDGPAANDTGTVVSTDGAVGVDAKTSDGSTVATDGPAGSAMLSVVATKGGTLSLGTASAIPANALATDKMITISTSAPTAEQAARGDISGSIYTLGPDGTQFVVPVALSLPLTTTVPADKDAVIAWLDGNTGLWVNTPSSVSGTTITGQVTHFTSFAVLFVGKGGMCPAAPACGGGMPTGTWEISAACLPAGGPMELGENCGNTGEKIYLRSTLTITGTVSFTDGRFSATEKLVGTQYVNYPAACLAIINSVSTKYATCADVQTALNKDPKIDALRYTCAGLVAEGCSCVGTKSQDIQAAGTVMASGNQITFMGDTATKPAKPSDYCLKGNVLTISSPDGVYTAIKK